jgi:MFS family permease
MASQICFVVANTLLAHYARWIEHLGGNLSDVGYINGAGAILGILMRPWLGQWINEFGAKKLWMIGYLIFALSSLGNLLLVDIGLPIYFARSGLVAGAAIVFSSGLAYITQVAPDNRRAEAIGILGAGGFIGMLVGPYLGDWLLGPKLEGISRDRSVFTTLFITATVANIVPTFILLFVQSPKTNTVRAANSISGFLTTTLRYWPGPIVNVLFVFGICITAPFVFLASFVDKTPLIIGDYSVMGIFFLCYGGWGLFLRIAWRRLPDRVGPRKVLIAGLVFMTAGMFAYGIVSEARPWLIIVPALLTGTGHSFMYHSMASLAIEPFPREYRGTGSALLSIVMDSGILIGATTLGIIGERFGFTWLFFTIGIACVLSGTHYALSHASSSR